MQTILHIHGNDVTGRTLKLNTTDTRQRPDLGPNLEEKKTPYFMISVGRIFNDVIFVGEFSNERIITIFAELIASKTVCKQSCGSVHECSVIKLFS